MMFVHIKHILGPGRVRLCGPCGTVADCHLVITARHLCKQAKSFLHGSKRAKPNRNGVCVSFETVLSAPTTRSLSMDVADF